MVEEWAAEWVAWLVELPAPIVWAVMTVSSGLEYVFPPFPGDAIALGGGVLAGTTEVRWLPVFFAVTIGSVGGAWIDFEVGRWLNRDESNTWLHRWMRRPRVALGISRVIHGFNKHGDLYLVINRFLPGIRAFFFVAAGMANLPRARVLILATLAALLWNALLVAVGLMVGTNLDEILAFLSAYSKIAWALLGLVVLILVFRWLRA